MMTNGKENGYPDRLLISDEGELRRQVAAVVAATQTIDMHTHLYPAGFGEMNLSGIDEILTYHYLVAEVFRFCDVSPENFWRLNKQQQADLIWRELFVENTPLSEAALGVLTVLKFFGLDTNATDLTNARDYFRSADPAGHLDRVLSKAGVSDVVMTNDPLDPAEAEVWKSGKSIDPRFHAALRLDRMLNSWPNAAARLAQTGCSVDEGLTGGTIAKVRGFLDEWIGLMKPLYMAVSLPDDFQYPGGDVRSRIIGEIVLPTAREHGLPFALMIGVRRNVNPALRAAGDGVGRADVGAIERICVENPDVRFFASVLSRENQFELCVAARKFSNLMPFGCWWFLNNPSIIAEITRQRLELLGTSFIPQHSDSRVLEQLVYKWDHSRRVIADCLNDSYKRLMSVGRRVTRDDIERDVSRMFSGNFRKWAGLPATRSVESEGRISGQEDVFPAPGFTRESVAGCDLS